MLFYSFLSSLSDLDQNEIHLDLSIYNFRVSNSKHSRSNKKLTLIMQNIEETIENNQNLVENLSN